MLQQTQVATVIPYYLRFMERFPTLESLAEAPVDEVLRHWSGLGYYARARNLHAAAKVVVTRFGGEIPTIEPEIMELPGIGRYTAGAILSIAYDLPFPIVDANVIRVVSRLFCVEGDPKSTATHKRLWELATLLVPEQAPGDFNQGLMELGALICDAFEPKCASCPLLTDCQAGNSKDPTAFPQIPAGKATVLVQHASLCVQRADGRVCIVQRPLQGLWGGLWEFPRVVLGKDERLQEALERCGKEYFGIPLATPERIATIKHAVTHHKITLHGYFATPSEPLPLQTDSAFWVLPDRLGDYGFSSPQVQLCMKLAEFLRGGSQRSKQLEIDL